MTDNGPVNLAERRAAARCDAREWAARDLAEHLLRRIEAGEINPSRIIVHYLEGNEREGWRHYHMCAGVNVDTHLSLLAIAKDSTIRDWRDE